MPITLSPELQTHLSQLAPDAPMPALFIGHGNPMNAITDNAYKETWQLLGQLLPKPKAILVISAHWLTEGATHIVTNTQPRTIHDFYGFPEALHRIQYPAAGAPDLAAQIMQMIKNPSILGDDQWGLDHGAWCVLKPMFPEAIIPVLQLSLDIDSTPQQRYDLGKQLQILRHQGLMLMGSGNLVHNLRQMNVKMPYQGHAWAQQYDAVLAEWIEQNELPTLLDIEQLPNTALAHPTLEHYWPLLYILGSRLETERVWYFNESLDLGSISMRSMLFSGN